MMTRFLTLATMILALAVTGCSSSESTSVLENADQAAIDAYNAQAAENDKALSDYKDVQ